MTGKLGIFGSHEKQRAWLELAKQVEQVGVDHIPCSQAPDLFFAESTSNSPQADIQVAKRACKSCPLLMPCATYAIEWQENDGVWGGMSASERRQIRKRHNA